VLISAIPPTFMKSERHPDGLPKEVVDSTAMLPRNTAHSFIMTLLSRLWLQPPGAARCVVPVGNLIPLVREAESRNASAS
jgi:hypothetical protein